MTKTISLMTVMVLGMLITKAQETTKKSSGGTTFGIRGGINFQNINGKDDNGDKMKNDMLVGFNAGINAEIPLAAGFFLQPGLLYSVKGTKNSDFVLGQTYTSNTSVSYIELPVNFIYKPTLGKGHILLGAGPYVAMGISGTVKRDGGGLSTSNNVKFKNTVTAAEEADNNAYVRPLDAGANILAGYEFSNKFSLQLNAQLGLTKINPNYDTAPNNKSTAYNTGFGFSLGYRF